MRINTRVVSDIRTGDVLKREWIEWSGTIAFCKGDKTAQAAEVQQLDFNAQMMQVFKAQYGDQKAQLDFLNSIMRPLIEKPRGLSDEDLTAARTSATENVIQQYKNVETAVKSRFASTNTTGLPTGTEEQILSSVALGKAQDIARAQNDITMQNEQVKQANFWNAVSSLSGSTQMLNPLGYAGTATQGGNTVANLSQAVTASQQSGWLNAALGALGGVAGGWAMGGFKMPGSRPA